MTVCQLDTLEALDRFVRLARQSGMPGDAQVRARISIRDLDEEGS